MSLPKITMALSLTDPEWEAVFVEGNNQAINMDSYRKEYKIEVEVVQLNLNSGGMRIRYEWPNKHRKSGMEVCTQDVSIEHFYKHYQINKIEA